MANEKMNEKLVCSQITNIDELGMGSQAVSAHT
jgi:hypothetical protein